MNNVKEATLDDFPQVKEINSLLRINVDNFYWDSDAYIRNALLDKRCYVVKEDNIIQGSLIIEKRGPDETHPYPSLAIGVLSVLPGKREKGLGTHLVERAKTLAFKENKRLYVECFFEYDNLDYYKKIGFSEDRIKDYNGKKYHVLFLDPKTIPPFPEFKRIDIGDRMEYLFYLEKMETIPSDVTFENLFVYDSPERKISLSILNGNIIVRTRRTDSCRFYPPVGNNRLDETILECLAWAKNEPGCPGFACVPNTLIDALKPETKEKLRIVPDRNAYDYLYDVNYHLFEGPNLRTQHQNLTHFLNKKPNYKDLTYGMVDAVSEFQTRWMNEYHQRMKNAKRPASDFLEAENKAIHKAVTHCKSLNLRIGAVYLDRMMTAFSIAGIYRKTGYIHFEKAIRDRGAYQSLIYYFGKSALYDVGTVNKEQDLGIPGLRTSKERYQPKGFVEKCSLMLND